MADTNPLQTFADILEILDAKYVIQPATKDKEGNLLLLLNDFNAASNRSYDADLLCVLNYLVSSWIRFARYAQGDQSNDAHFALLIDRRDASWEQVETLFETINKLVASSNHQSSDSTQGRNDVSFFNWRDVLKRIFVLRPTRFTALFSASSSQKTITKQSPIPVTFISSTSQLHALIAPEALPAGELFSGSFPYDHERWMKQRNAMESYLQIAVGLERKVAAITERWRVDHARIHRSVKSDTLGNLDDKTATSISECKFLTVAECAQLIRDEEQRAYALQLGIELFLEDVESLVGYSPLSPPLSASFSQPINNNSAAFSESAAAPDASDSTAEVQKTNGARSSSTLTLRSSTQTLRLDARDKLYVLVLQQALRLISAVYARYKRIWHAHRNVLQCVLDLRRFDERAILVERELDERMFNAIESARRTALETLKLDELKTVLGDLIALQTNAANQDCLERLNELLLFGADRDQTASTTSESVVEKENEKREQEESDAGGVLEIDWCSRLDRLRCVNERLRTLLEECERCLRAKERVLVAIEHLQDWCVRCDALLETLVLAEREQSQTAADSQVQLPSYTDAQQVADFADEYDGLVAAFGGEAKRELADVITPKLANRIQMLIGDAAAHVDQLRASHRRLEQAARERQEALKRSEDLTDEVVTSNRLSQVIDNTLKRGARGNEKMLSQADDSTPNATSDFANGFNTLKRLRETQQLELGSNDEPMSNSGAMSTSILSTSGLRHSPSVAVKDKQLLRCRYVVNELLETERAYVTDLETVVRGYVNAWRDDAALAQLLPTAFRSAPETQFATLLGNLPAILDFHQTSVLVHLLNTTQPTDNNVELQLCDVFINSETLFIQLYAQYCKSRSAADALLRSVNLDQPAIDSVAGENEHPYFSECRRRLGHRLPLDAYLLKPTQRITKYQLLLADLLRSVRAFEQTAEPQDTRTARIARLCGSANRVELAHSTMLRVLASINNAMHEAMILPSKQPLSFGCLLLQAGCTVLYKLASRGSTDVELSEPLELSDSIGATLKQHYYAQRTHHRHIFLYERCVLFCKPVNADEELRTSTSISAATGGKTLSRLPIGGQMRYRVKHILELTRVGLTESLTGNPRRFELWTPRDRSKYILEMKNNEEKNTWVQAIKKLLFEQLQQIKMNRISGADVRYIDLHPCTNENCSAETCKSELCEVSETATQSEKSQKSSSKVKQKMLQFKHKLGPASHSRKAHVDTGLTSTEPTDSDRDTLTNQSLPSADSSNGSNVAFEPGRSECSATLSSSSFADTDARSISSADSAAFSSLGGSILRRNDSKSGKARTTDRSTQQARSKALFIALSDYIAVTDRELNVREGELLQMAHKRIKSTSQLATETAESESGAESEHDEPVYADSMFVYVRKLETDEFGYVPVSYLTRREPLVDECNIERTPL